MTKRLSWQSLTAPLACRSFEQQRLLGRVFGHVNLRSAEGACRRSWKGVAVAADSVAEVIKNNERIRCHMAAVVSTRYDF